MDWTKADIVNFFPQQFKGVLTAGLGYLYTATRDSNLRNFLNTNMLANVQNNMDYSYLFSEYWDGPFNSTLGGPKTQIGIMPLLTAAVVANRLDATTTDPTFQSSGSSSTTITIPLTSSTSVSAASSSIQDLSMMFNLKMTGLALLVVAISFSFMT